MDIGWFTGVLEAEGSISAQVYTQRNGFVRITPFIAIVNTDEGILAECYDTMSKLAESEKSPPRMCNHSGATHKPVKCIRLDGASIKPVLEAMLPHMRSEKKRNAEVLLKYLESRKNAQPIFGERGHIKAPPITRAEVAMISSIRTHKAAKSFEAICAAPNIV